MFVGTVITSLGVVREQQSGTLEQLAVMPLRPADVFLGKIIPYFAVAVVDPVVVLAVGVAVFGVPFRGSVAVFGLGALLFVFVALSLGALISSVSQTLGKAIQLAVMTLLPQVLLSGLIFPLTSIVIGVRWIAYLLPLTYFTEISRGVMLRAEPIGSLWPPFVYLALLGAAVTGLAIWPGCVRCWQVPRWRARCWQVRRWQVRRCACRAARPPRSRLRWATCPPASPQRPPRWRSASSSLPRVDSVYRVAADEPRRGPGRRAGESRTREAILDAARRRFGEQGYDGATIRGIAADAGVNPALVHHFYGTKERLFAAAMRLPVVPSDIITSVLGAERDRLGDDFLPRIGEVLTGTMLRAWDVADIRTAFIGLLRSAATSEQGVTMLREFVTGTILASLIQVAGLSDDEEGRYRATLVASQVVGLGFARYVLGLEPVASATTEDLVAAIGPTMQRYLTGDIGPVGLSS